MTERVARGQNDNALSGRMGLGDPERHSAERPVHVFQEALSRQLRAHQVERSPGADHACGSLQATACRVRQRPAQPSSRIPMMRQGSECFMLFHTNNKATLEIATRMVS